MDPDNSKNCKANKCKATCQLRQEMGELRSMVIQQGNQLERIIENQERCCTKPKVPQSPCDCESTVQPTNGTIDKLKPDTLFYLGLDTSTTDFPTVFGDVKFVCLGETEESMENFVMTMNKDIQRSSNNMMNLTGSGNRFAIYKAGPVLCVNHGIGTSSVTALLNELIRLMYHAGCQDPIFIRIGTCCGLNLPPGTVVISEEAVDGQARSEHEAVIMGTPQPIPTMLDEQLAQDILEMARRDDGFETVKCKTMSVADFYEAQGRMDGAFADYSDTDRERYLGQLSDQGIRSIDMESAALAALTHKANIRCAVVCVTIVDRMKDDQIDFDRLKSWEQRPHLLVSRYISQVLRMHKSMSSSSARASTSRRSSQHF